MKISKHQLFIHIKLILFGVIFINSRTIGYNQLSINTKVGLNYGTTKINVEPNFRDSYDNAFGFRFGLISQYKIKNFILGTGCLVSFRPTCAKYAFFEGRCGTLYFNFIEIPISLHHTFIKNKLVFGLSLINGFTKHPPIHLIEDKEYELDFEVHLGWIINPRFNIEISYLVGGLDPLNSNRDTHLFYVGSLSLNYTIFNFKLKP
ncbi:MAG: hypothetical protein IPM92_02955 [Saprospiraceae bacterium]|nr:hypothetical protein [Saprospiraceae bacterium]